MARVPPATGSVVQATCPGCQNVLRVPADMVTQPIQCKHCKTVLRLKQPATPVASAPARRPAPPPVPARTPPPVPVADLVEAVAPAEESADPAPRRKKSRGAAFENLEGDDAPTDRVRRRARGSGVVLPLILIGLVLAGAAAAVVAFWPQIQAALNGESPDPHAEKKPPAKDAGKGVPAGGYPRRALIVSTHKYLYANPVHAGPPGQQAHSLSTLVNTLNTALKIPLNQIAHLSDEAGRGTARAPLKPVIEKTVADFLDGCRAQDRVLFFLVGHSAEIEDKVYYVPIEGEMEVAESLIPMAWFLEKLAACKAKQKILVVDVNRENPTYGRERPTSGPMSEKLEALLKSPPEGVQVWSACSKDEYSYETDTDVCGAFLGTLRAEGGKLLQGKISREADPLPIDLLHERLPAAMRPSLNGLKQTPFLAGAAKDNGAEYDAKEPLAKEPTLAPLPGGQAAVTLAAANGVLDEIRVPSLKVSKEGAPDFNLVPPKADVMKDYVAGGDATPIRKKVQQARAVLWAISKEEDVPADLKALVAEKRDDLRVDLGVLQDGYGKPAAAQENAFKANVEADERKVAVMLGALTEAHEELKDLEAEREKETKRWQANYDFIVAHLEAKIAYLFEYQSMLGQMRREYPEHDAKIHVAFKLASRQELSGDATGRKLAKTAHKTFTTLAEEAKGTPWEVLAKREKLTNLGLEWKPSTTR